MAIVFTGAVWFVDSAQTFESYYETYQKLKETERISRGWVSRVIPTSSYDIRAVHQLNGELVDGVAWVVAPARACTASQWSGMTMLTQCKSPCSIV